MLQVHEIILAIIPTLINLGVAPFDGCNSTDRAEYTCGFLLCI